MRGVIRQILYLPKNTPTAAFHLSVVDGWRIGNSLSLRQDSYDETKKINNLASDSYGLLKNLAGHIYVSEYVAKFKPRKIFEISVLSASSAAPLWASALHSTLDGFY